MIIFVLEKRKVSRKLKAKLKLYESGSSENKYIDIAVQWLFKFRAFLC